MIVEGAAVLEGTGTLAGAGTLTLVGASSISGVGTLTASIPSASLSGAGSLTATGLVALKISHIQAMTADLSDREIYNDIRSECDISEILGQYVAEHPEYFDTIDVRASILPYIAAGETREYTVYANPGDTEITWITGWADCSLQSLQISEAECLAIDPDADWWSYMGIDVCYLSDPFLKYSFDVVTTTDNSMTISVTNNGDYTIMGSVYGQYIGLTPDKRYIKLRVTNGTSIAKYGRRTMDLVWPLGQDTDAMDEIMSTYLERYCEPVPFLRVTVLGKNEHWQARICDSEINDRIWIPCPPLDMDEEFWLNNLYCQHDAKTGILEATFDLEQIREMERI